MKQTVITKSVEKHYECQLVFACLLKLSWKNISTLHVDGGLATMRGALIDLWST